MAKVQMMGHSFYYPVQDVLQLFYGQSFFDEKNHCCVAGNDAWTLTSFRTENTIVTSVLGRPELQMSISVSEIYVKREIKRQLYFVLSKLLQKSFPWGSLTGIRPTLIAREVASSKELSSTYGVREDKSILSIKTAQIENETLSHISPSSHLMYIGVPFCKSRCSYCSFVSEDTYKKEHLLPAFKEALLKEMDGFFQAFPDIQISSLYIGGGTPTVFSDADFNDFMQRLFRLLKGKNIKEITVEAGRPDTITKEKLLCLKAFGVERICINPQTLQDKTLERIGRKHSVQAFFDAFYLAREIGFSSINTDIIAGLPGEAKEDFIRTLEGLISLSPENITVHSLSKKRTSHLTMLSSFPEDESDITENMVTYAHKRLAEEKYLPYYLYRQKSTLGGQENTGYTRKGFACDYNTAMMSDLFSVIAFGSGISKRVFPGGRLERCQGLKNPEEYMKRVDEMIQKKITFFR